MSDRDHDDGVLGATVTDLTLTTAGGSGILEELFLEEQKRVLENILDPNTDAKATREITLTIKYQPQQTREQVNLVVGSKVKLAPFMGAAATVYVGMTKDGPKARTINPNQGHFDLSESEDKPSLRRVGGTGTQ